MTDNEIIKALEKALEVEVVHGIETRGYYLSSEILKATIDIINRQKAEIEDKAERLRKVLPIVAELKAEAIKEFAERLKKVLLEEDGYYCDIFNEIEFCEAINNLVKEIIGGQNYATE